MGQYSGLCPPEFTQPFFHPHLGVLHKGPESGRKSRAQRLNSLAFSSGSPILPKLQSAHLFLDLPRFSSHDSEQSSTLLFPHAQPNFFFQSLTGRPVKIH